MSEMHDHHHHERRHGLLLAVGLFFLAIGVSVGGYFVGNMMYKAKVAANIATVKGFSEREVKANIGLWRINFEASATTLAAAYENGAKSRDKIVAFLKEAGFSEEEISPSALTVTKQESRDNTNKLIETTYNLSGAVSLRSEQVDKVAQTSQRAGDLVGDGVLLIKDTNYGASNDPQYEYTKLNEIKPAMLAEATKNARLAAEQFAKDAGASVGRLNSVDQGSFSIAERDVAGESESYNASKASLYKKVRVVTTISFYLN